MAMAGLYRRILPSPPAIDFASADGKVRFMLFPLFVRLFWFSSVSVFGLCACVCFLRSFSAGFDLIVVLLMFFLPVYYEPWTNVEFGVIGCVMNVGSKIGK